MSPLLQQLLQERRFVHFADVVTGQTGLEPGPLLHSLAHQIASGGRSHDPVDPRAADPRIVMT